MITEVDVRAAKVISPQRVGEDVCTGVATVPSVSPRTIDQTCLRGTMAQTYSISSPFNIRIAG
jgi:hypothetical protein